MVFFITALRALAAILITNAHYTDVYPVSIIASGGLLGDVLFFAVSGYCLSNIRTGFLPWYGKRLMRVYPPVLLITLIYMLLGFYRLGEWNLAQWYLYPTYYHFVASIIVLYIPYYFVAKYVKSRKQLLAVAGAVLAVWVLAYAFGYDKSRYHIDTVREPMIRFLFFEAMLMGLYFKRFQRPGSTNRGKRCLSFLLLFALIVLYFATKLLFSRRASLAPWQLLNQFVLLALLYSVFSHMSRTEGWLHRLPAGVWKAVSFLAGLTLEIYLVQYVVIEQLAKAAPFPLNWLIVTGVILLAAFALQWLNSAVVKGAERIIGRMRKA
ncbi:MAG: acyltransferase [Clostridia bacterium]|nr:acyltransferase [Clostridia bacterium]